MQYISYLGREPVLPLCLLKSSSGLPTSLTGERASPQALRAWISTVISLTWLPGQQTRSRSPRRKHRSHGAIATTPPEAVLPPSHGTKDASSQAFYQASRGTCGCKCLQTARAPHLWRSSVFKPLRGFSMTCSKDSFAHQI